MLVVVNFRSPCIQRDNVIVYSQNEIERAHVETHLKEVLISLIQFKNISCDITHVPQYDLWGLGAVFAPDPPYRTGGT